jgi:DNA repair exonuclease SbcCD ATPase subunit
MNFLVYLLAKVSIGLTEIIIFQLVSLVLGFAIHFYLTHRKIMPTSVSEQPVLAEAPLGGADEWRLKYFEEVDMREQLNKEAEELKEKAELMELEVEELRLEVTRLEKAVPEVKAYVPEELPQGKGSNYMNQLRNAQESLFEHNQNVGKLLQQVEMLKESEQKYAEVQELNEALGAQLREARRTLVDREAELKHLRQQQALSNEVKGRLEKAYEEFNVLQDRLHKMETAGQPQHKGYEYEELQQAYFKITREYDEVKMKQVNMLEEHQRLARLLADTEDKLRESNFQRQQLLKKVSYLEELNTDLQQIAEHNKKLDIQLKRISEIEILLSRLSDDKNAGK